MPRTLTCVIFSACLPLLAACSPEPPPLSAVEALDTRPPPDWCDPGQTLTVDAVTGWATCTAYTRAHGEWAGGLIGGVRALQKLAKGVE